MRNNTGDGNASRNLRDALFQLGHEVDVVTSSINTDEDYSLNITPLNQRFPYYNAADRFTFRAKRLLNEITSKISLESYDVIFCVAWQTWAVDIIRLFPDEISKKCLLISHGTYFKNHVGKLSLFKSIRWLEYKHIHLPNVLNRISGLVVLTNKGVGDRFHNLTIAKKMKKRIFILSNTVPSNYIEASYHNFGDRPIKLVSVSGFNSLKDPIFLIETFPVDSNFVLTIYGTQKNEYYEKCKKRIVQRGLQEKVKLKVNVNHHEIQEDLRRSHINIVSSKTECQPLSILEGLSVGLPFVSRRIPAISTIKRGITAADEFFWETLENIFVSRDNYLNLRAEAFAEFANTFSEKRYRKNLDKIIFVA